MKPKSIIKMKFLINFQFIFILSILLLFGLIPITFGYSTDLSIGTSNEEDHLFRHRHHQHHHKHHHHQQQQQKQQQQEQLSNEYNYNNHRLENVVDKFKKSQDIKHENNITMINLRHHRTYIVENNDDSGSSSDGILTTEQPILQFAPLSLDSVSALSTNKNHHLRHHNRHHQVWEQRVFPSLRHHPTTMNIITMTTTQPPPITTTITTTTTNTDRSLLYPKKKFHYFNNFGGRRSGISDDTIKSNFNIDTTNNQKYNLTRTSRYFDHNGLYSWNGFTTRPSITKLWQSFDNKHFLESSSRTFSDDNRFNLNDENDDNDSSDSNESNSNNDEVDRRKNLIKKKKKLQLQQQKKKKSNLMNKKLNFSNIKNVDEYYEDDDDDDGDDNDENGEGSESVEEDDYNSEENSHNDDDASNTNRNYVERRRTLSKRKIFNVNSDDIYSRSYKPGTLTQQKYEMLGTHEAVKQSRKLHITNQKHHKALANAHITKVTKEAACGIPKPRVERIQHESSKLYVPHCTILHRCGDDTGCCLSDSKTCVAKKTNDVALYFFVKSMNSNQGTIERLTFKNHTECHCVQKSKHNINNNINLMMEPAMLRKATVLDCNCPKLFEKVLQDDGYCRCDCSSGNSNCDWLKRGMEHFSMADRKCITEGRCKPPTCEFGNYVKKHGRCPKKDDKISYSRSLL